MYNSNQTLISDKSNQKIKKILVIDDHKEIRESVGFLVGQMGFDVYTANNGQHGVEMYKQYVPDLVFLDIRMPIMSGCDAFEEIKKINSDVKIIFLTAFFSDTCLTSILKFHDVQIIEKPFDMYEIEKAIKSS